MRSETTKTTKTTKTTRNGIIAGTALVMAAALMTPAHISAQTGSRGPGSMGGGRAGMIPGLRQLDLSDAQREEIRAAREQYHDEALAEQLRTARRALNEAVTADVVNESAIRGLVAQTAPLEADAAVQRAYVHAAVLAVLTEDQREELRQLQSEAQERFGERMRRRREAR